MKIPPKNTPRRIFAQFIVLQCYTRIMLATTLFGLALLAQAPSSTETKPPTLRLGSTVVPVEYGLVLRVDPNKENFSGVVKAVVDVREPVKRFWVNSATN